MIGQHFAIIYYNQEETIGSKRESWCSLSLLLAL